MTRVNWSEPYFADGEDSIVNHQRLMQRRRDRQIQDGLVAVPSRWQYGRQVMFGDDSTREAHERRCRAIRRTMVHAYEVAPMHRVTLPSGYVLQAGDVVRPEHFRHEDEKRLPQLIIQQLVRSGVVLEADDPPDGSPLAA
jgi:hypothetical protein